MAKIERDSRRILQRLLSEGWETVHSSGSHRKLKNPNFKHPIILVHPKKDLPLGTARQIHKVAGWLKEVRK